MSEVRVPATIVVPVRAQTVRTSDGSIEVVLSPAVEEARLEIGAPVEG